MTWQSQQTGLCVESRSGSLSGFTSVHEIVAPSGARSAGRCSVHVTSGIRLSQKAQDWPSYQPATIVLTRQAPGSRSTSVRHSCPHPAFSGQREQLVRRNRPGSVPNALEGRAHRIELDGGGPLRLGTCHEARASVDAHDRNQDESREEGESEEGEQDQRDTHRHPPLFWGRSGAASMMRRHQRRPVYFDPAAREPPRSSGPASPT